MIRTTTDANCPSCKIGSCQETLERETFPYGDEAIEISAVVPVLRCDACGFVFTDQRAEKERHRAVCEHLGLLPPARIQHIRKAVLGMSRDVFHAAYGLSAASVERWENGKLIQGEAADTLIRALEDPTLAKRLDRRKTDSPSESHTAGDNVIWARFPSLGKRQARADDALARSKDFNLRINAC